MKRNHFEWLLIICLTVSLYLQFRQNSTDLSVASRVSLKLSDSKQTPVRPQEPLSTGRNEAKPTRSENAGPTASRLAEGAFAFKVAGGALTSRWVEMGFGPTFPEEWSTSLNLSAVELTKINDQILKTLTKMQDLELQSKKLQSNAAGDVYSIPAYKTQCDALIREFRENCLAEVGPSSGIAVNIAAESPYFKAGYEDVTISAVLEGTNTGVFLGLGKTQMTSMGSGLGVFAKTRYGQIIDFSAIENANTK